jgi:hypothetical protein
MRRRNSKRRAEPPENDGPGALTAAELAERFVAALLDHAREVEVDAGDAAAMAALDSICCRAVYGPAPLAAVLDTLAKAAPVRIALVKDAQTQSTTAAAWRRQARPAGAYRRQSAELAEACELCREQDTRGPLRETQWADRPRAMAQPARAASSALTRT